MKKVCYILFNLILFSHSIFSQVNLKNGLVACYPFNANAKDESGNGNDGVVNNATLTTDRFGNTNSAYNFNGVNQFIEVSANKFKNNNYSFSIWANPDEIPVINNYSYPFSVGGPGGDQSLDLSNSAHNATGWTFGGYLLGDSRVPFCHQGYLPTVPAWFHIVGVRDNNTMYLYVNGQLVMSENTGGFMPSYGSNTKVTIGCRSSLVQFFKGKVDDIHLYNRPLNAAEVKALYDGNTTPTITITTNSASPCGGDKITFTANGGNTTSKYSWKIDDVTQTSTLKTLDYVSTKKTGDYQIKVAVEVTDGEPCFPQDPSKKEETFTIKDCTVPTSVNLKNGLVACYPFNANAKDESGNGNDGVVNNATLTVDRFGNTNSAYSFNGNNYISLPSDKFALNEYSYSTWIHVTSLPADGQTYRILSIGGSCGDQNIDISNNYFGVTGIDGGGYDVSSTPRVTGATTAVLPNIGKWYHVTVTRDKNNVKLYIDGTIIQTSSTNGSLPYYGCSRSVKANIGTRSTNDQSFVGGVDDIHLYNRPLNAAEVKALYDGNTPPTITITTNSASPCGGDKITFTANGGNATSKYLWKIDDVIQTSSSKTLDYTSTKKTGDYQVKVAVEVTDGEPCFPQDPSKKEEIFTIKDCVESDKILIPNAFSPNSDGVNDTWEIHGIKNNPDVIVEIYDRWGELIFYSKGYSTPWDGTYKNSPLNEGTYAYVVKSSNDLIFKGAILLVR